MLIFSLFRCFLVAGMEWPLPSSFLGNWSPAVLAFPLNTRGQHVVKDPESARTPTLLHGLRDLQRCMCGQHFKEDTTLALGRSFEEERWHSFPSSPHRHPLATNKKQSSQSALCRALGPGAPLIPTSSPAHREALSPFPSLHYRGSERPAPALGPTVGH